MDTRPTVTGEGGLKLGPITQVSLLVRDIERAVGFYRDQLGLTHLFTAGDLAFFDLGGVRLYLHAVAEEDWRPSSVIYLAVEDIHRAYQLLQHRGVDGSGAPHVVHTHPDGTQEWMAFFADGEGNTLALLERVGPERTDP